MIVKKMEIFETILYISAQDGLFTLPSISFYLLLKRSESYKICILEDNCKTIFNEQSWSQSISASKRFYKPVSMAVANFRWKDWSFRS